MQRGSEGKEVLLSHIRWGCFQNQELWSHEKHVVTIPSMHTSNPLMRNSIHYAVKRYTGVHAVQSGSG